MFKVPDVLLAIWVYITDPEARMVSDFMFGNGNVMSVREARLRGRYDKLTKLGNKMENKEEIEMYKSVLPGYQILSITVNLATGVRWSHYEITSKERELKNNEHNDNHPDDYVNTTRLELSNVEIGATVTIFDNLGRKRIVECPAGSIFDVSYGIQR